MGLDMTEATMWMVMNNDDTTKMPMDFDFIISVEDDTVSMSLGVVSSKPPTEDQDDELRDDATDPTNAESELENATVPISESADSELELSETMPPTMAPIRVEVNATIIIFNLEGLTAEFLNNEENAAIWADAFQAFVLSLMAGLEDQRHLLEAYRRLEVSLLSDSAIIFGIEDIDCPTESDQTIPANATCQTITGSYELAVFDEDPVAVSDKYAEETERAIEEGKLEESLHTVNPDFPAQVHEASVVVHATVERTETEKSNTTASVPENETPALGANSTLPPGVNATQGPSSANSTSPGIIVTPSAGSCRGRALAWLSLCIASFLIL